MLVRIVQFLIGAMLAGGGGYLGWLNRAEAGHLFPPGAAGAPWMLVAGVLGLTSGIVFIVSAVHPRPERKARLAEEAAQRDAKLGAADSYYAGRNRAADRDWRSGDIAPPAQPVAPPAPQAASPPVVEPVRAAPAPPPAPPPPAPPPPVAPPPPPSSVAKPVATSTPPVIATTTPFPSSATLAPIPRAAEPPPPPAPAPVAAPALAPVTADAGPFAAIRAAIRDGKLDDADKMLATGRESADGLALAELTALAGDHAAAAGRQSNAKWLWRLALKRFGELGAMDSAVARAVAESLRVAG